MSKLLRLTAALGLILLLSLAMQGCEPEPVLPASSCNLCEFREAPK